MLNLISAIHGNGVAASTNSYESISTVTLTSSASSISFSSIPSTYKHLQIRCLTTCTSPASSATMQFNGDSGANYKSHALYGSGGGTGAFASTPIYIPGFMGGGKTTSPGAAIIDVLDYQNTNKYKTVRSLDGYDANGSGYISLNSGLWMSTAAITSITFSFTSFSDGSQFALYGIKG
jgi:hypothetical protein